MTTNKLGITNAMASANILRAVKTCSLVQSSWHSEADDGREIACLLGSIDKRVSSPSDCNADLMPLWLAGLTPVLFDGLAETDVYPVAERYGRAVGAWGRLSAGQWDGVLTKFLCRTIDFALDAARPGCVGKSYWKAVEDAGAQSKAAIILGGIAARAAARAAADAAADAAAADAAAYAAAYAAARAAARAAAYAADYAADYAAGAAARAAGAAARTAAYAADGAAADAAARAAADAAARAAAGAVADAADAAADAAAGAAGVYLKLFNFLLGAIETEVAAP